MMVGFIIVGAILLIENAILIPLMIKYMKNHIIIIGKMEKYKKSSDFHINELKKRYEEEEDEYDRKRNR